MASKKKKAGKKSSCSKNNECSEALVLDVPRCGQVVRYFNLVPALPSKGAPGDWLFTEEGCDADISQLKVNFEPNESALERELERAVLIIKIQENPKADGKWRFALTGVATDSADEDPNNDITFDIIDNGFTMLVYLQVLGTSEEQISFGFVASFTNAKTHRVKIYESQDPVIIPVRTQPR